MAMVPTPCVLVQSKKSVEKELSGRCGEWVSIVDFFGSYTMHCILGDSIHLQAKIIRFKMAILFQCLFLSGSKVHRQNIYGEYEDKSSNFGASFQKTAVIQSHVKSPIKLPIPSHYDLTGWSESDPPHPPKVLGTLFESVMIKDKVPFPKIVGDYPP